ncbi:MAG TPA: ankyrin repeat domain-containing protein [Candidatus Omnitrophota bacterium]|nr:ankyrin repeat domain-containing protein [Candidatus Omnitrophota bacterium]
MIRLIRTILFSIIFLFGWCTLAPAQYTPGGLFSLARAGDIEGLKALLATKPPAPLVDSALEAAVIGNQPEAIKLLIEHGANVNFQNPNGTALLVNAIMLEVYDAATTLTESGADPNVSGYNRLYQGYPMSWQWTPLMAASYQGQLELVKLLVEKGADISKEGYSVSQDEPEAAADIAAYSGRLEILLYLLDQGATLKEDTIFKSARGGHLDVVQFLVKGGFDVNTPGPNRGKTLLMEAAWWGHLGIVEFLLKSKADVNAADQNGYTALSDAAANNGDEFPNQLEIVKTLVRSGADIRKADAFQLTPLMRAKDPKVIEFLVEAGAR